VRHGFDCRSQWTIAFHNLILSCFNWVLEVRSNSKLAYKVTSPWAGAECTVKCKYRRNACGVSRQFRPEESCGDVFDGDDTVRSYSDNIPKGFLCPVEIPDAAKAEDVITAIEEAKQGCSRTTL
jgi:hypothetical protein